MSLLFANVVLKPMFSLRFFATFFSFRHHGHIFQLKEVLSFSLTHKLLKCYVCEVASIFVHSWLREKREEGRNQLFQRPVYIGLMIRR